MKLEITVYVPFRLECLEGAVTNEKLFFVLEMHREELKKARTNILAELVVCEPDLIECMSADDIRFTLIAVSAEPDAVMVDLSADADEIFCDEGEIPEDVCKAIEEVLEKQFKVPVNF